MRRINLKIFRIRQDLTKTEMAERLNWDRLSYGAIEAGKRDPSIAFFYRLQEVFNISDEQMWELTLHESQTKSR